MTRVSPVQAPMGLWSIPDDLPAALRSAYVSASAGFWISIIALVAGNSLIKSTLVSFQRRYHSPHLDDLAVGQRGYPAICMLVGYGCIDVRYPTESHLVGYHDRAHLPP